MGTADALMLTVGMDVRIIAATVAAAAGSLAKRLITLFTFPQRAMALTKANFRQAH
jgi:hypothetical protein